MSNRCLGAKRTARRNSSPRLLSLPESLVWAHATLLGLSPVAWGQAPTTSSPPSAPATAASTMPAAPSGGTTAPAAPAPLPASTKPADGDGANEETSPDQLDNSTSTNAVQPPPPPTVFELPQWANYEAQALDAGTRVPNLGRGLFSSTLYPLQPQGHLPDQASPGLATTPTLPSEVFTKAPREKLIDPLGLISSSQKPQLLKLLHLHALSDHFPLHVLVINPSTTLPPSDQEPLWLKTWQANAQSAAVLIWRWNAPSDSKLLISPQTETSSIQTMTAAAQAAAAGYEPSGQLSQYLLYLTDGLRALPSPTAATNTTVAVAATSPIAVKDASTPLPGWLWPACGLLTGAALLAMILRIVHARKMSQALVFPESEVTPRLGAPHSGGQGAAVSWEG